MTAGSSLSLCHSMPSDASPAPARPGRLGGVLRDLGQVDVRDEVLRVGALQHHDPGVSRPDSSTPNRLNQVAHQLRPDQVHRRRVDHHAQHALGGPGATPQRAGLPQPSAGSPLRTRGWTWLTASLIRGGGSPSPWRTLAAPLALRLPPDPPAAGPSGATRARPRGQPTGSDGFDCSRGPRSLMATGPKKPEGTADTASARDPRGERSMKATRPRRLRRAALLAVRVISAAAALL